MVIGGNFQGFTGIGGGLADNLVLLDDKGIAMTCVGKGVSGVAGAATFNQTMRFMPARGQGACAFQAGLNPTARAS